MRISDWSSDVCSSDLASVPDGLVKPYAELLLEERTGSIGIIPSEAFAEKTPPSDADVQAFYAKNSRRYMVPERRVVRYAPITYDALGAAVAPTGAEIQRFYTARSEEHTSELQSLMRISYAVFCLKKKNTKQT